MNDPNLPEAPTAIDLARPDLYINRELSLLEFNKRVLAQALDANTPLLERMKFLCISSSNLDEFFEIRVAGLKQQVAFGSQQVALDGLTPLEQLNRVSEIAHRLVDEQYRALNEVMLPELDKQGIRFLRRSQWTEKQSEWVREFFHTNVLPVLTPIGLDPAHPFPRLLNKSLNFVVLLKGKDAFGRNSGNAVVQAPRSLPRLIQLPPEVCEGQLDIVFLSSVIHEHVGELFSGMTVKGCFQFRVTRNSDLFVDEEETEDLLRALQGELPSRRYGDAVRIEVADNCPPDTIKFLLKQFRLEERDLYQVNGPVNLNRLIHLYDLADRPDLKYPPFTPSTPKRVIHSGNMFEAIRSGDLLLHHPYRAFTPVLDFVRQAATDPNVLAIKQTLYRTGTDSALVASLAEAARNGKEVTVVIELRARFDEEANIGLATRLQEAGAQVVYGVVGYKTHAKMLLVVRREGRDLRRYVHLGTGNYHAKTARAYTDFGLFTCDPVIGEDVHKLFQQLTGLGKGTQLGKLLQSPFTLHKTMIECIQRETENARAGKEARIIVKMNALVEPQSIRALYEASQAGVQIDLIIRGICCLRPGVPGVSENIRVRSVVDRFLEHTRIYYFHNDGQPKMFCSSADWMERNFFHRVEVCFPIESPKVFEKVRRQGLETYLQSAAQCWMLQQDGSYQRVATEGAPGPSAQQRLIEEIAEPKA